VQRLIVEPWHIAIRARPLRILDFDCEARPLHWIASDYVSKELTAIAWAWVDQPEEVSVRLLGQVEPEAMLQAFCDAYHQADIVTGHFIRGYDLPMINGALTEYGMPALEDKLAQDTKLDLVKRQGLSNSQENIGAMLGLSHPKIKMDQQRWRTANRLHTQGFALTRERVIGDVKQHIEMRRRLLELGYLGPARLWKSKSHAPLDTYTP
jgi:hypothetical protein